MSKTIEIPFGAGVKVFFTLLLLLMCLACKTVKTTSNTKISSDSIVKTNIAAKVDETQHNEQLSAFRDQSQVSDETSETITEILWTAPDSIGKQYILKKTTTIRTRNARKAVDVTQQETSKKSHNTVSAFSDKTNSSTQRKAVATGMTKTKVSTPGFITWGVFSMVVAALAFVYFFLKSKRFFE